MYYSGFSGLQVEDLKIERKCHQLSETEGLFQFNHKNNDIKNHKNRHFDGSIVTLSR